MTDAIRYEKGQDNIVVLTMDMPGQSANTMNAVYREAMGKIVERLEAEKDSIAGVILTSAKKTFFAGGDLNELIKVTKADAKPFYDMILNIKGQLRRLETLGKPVVAAINGAALGGGWEIALACHHRIALNDASIQIGLPEVTLGLLPGGGGVVRMVRILGLEKALPYLAEGKKVRPDAALKAGLIHDLAENTDEMLAKARAWITANPAAVQPWDVKGYKIPGGTPSTPSVAQMLAIAPSVLRDKTKGCFPAPEKIMCAAVEGAQVDFDTAQLIEARYFTELTTGQVAKNMIGTFWFQLNDINAGSSRPQGYPKYQTKKVGVLGAGMMGAGIAYVSAAAGIEVVLKDVSVEAAEKGKSYSAKLLDKKVSRGHMTAEKARRLPGPHQGHRQRSRLRGLRPDHRSGVRGPQPQGQGHRRRRERRAGRCRDCVQHLDPADHRSGDGCGQAGEIHRSALLQPGRQDAAGGNHQGRENQRRDSGARLRLRAADQEDPDRGQRQPRLLHLPRVRHLHQRRHRHAGRGRERRDDRGRGAQGRHAGGPAGNQR